jgi:hypothetical protein
VQSKRGRAEIEQILISLFCDERNVLNPLFLYLNLRHVVLTMLTKDRRLTNQLNRKMEVSADLENARLVRPRPHPCLFNHNECMLTKSDIH